MATEAQPQPISAPPADKQLIDHEGKRYVTVKEGLAHILVPVPEEVERPAKNTDEVQQVFYNPIQQFNRDLTVLAIKAYGKAKVEEKAQISQAWREKLAEKKKRKRERLEQEADGPPAKTQKVSDEEARLPTTNQSTSGGVGDDSANAGSSDTPGDTNAKLGLSSELPPAPADGGADNAPAGEPPEPKLSAPKFTILDALSASGLRALRYAHEIPFVTSVTSNDIGKSAVESIKVNVEHNRLGSKIKVNHDDALAHMYSVVVEDLRRRSSSQGKPTTSSGKYDVVDLDPYGTAAPFLDAAVQAVNENGGLLCVTCTDSGVWASNGYPEKCYSLYGGIPVKGWYSHEVGVRIILHAIESSAARYGLAIEPLLSLSIDYYIRIFVKIRKSPAEVKFQGGKNMVVYACDSGCGAWTTQLLMKNKTAVNKKGDGVFYKHGMAAAPTAGSTCDHCGSFMHLAGPMYGGRIHSNSFIESVMAELSDAPKSVYGTTERIRGMLHTASEEYMPSSAELEAEAEQSESQAKAVQSDEEKRRAANKDRDSKLAKLAALEPYPFYFHAGQLSRSLHCTTPPDAAIRGALAGLGYRTTRSHCKPGSIKTDAPWSAIWQVMKEWVRQKAPVKTENIKPGSVAYRLLGLGKKDDEGEKGEESKESAKDEGDLGQAKIVFDESLGQDRPIGVRIVRYPNNPRENWGPMSKAKGK